MDPLSFTHFKLTGADASKFLQGQITIHIDRLKENINQYTVICDLKGRIAFGLWIKKTNPEYFDIVVITDQSDAFKQHVRKYGAFAKIELTEQGFVFPHIQNNSTAFSTEASDLTQWQQFAIEHGEAWISQDTAHMFQPQELRLHQRHGIEYDKGCYLGQEVIARLWFKAQPKQWLHLIQGTGIAPAPLSKLHPHTQVVNSITLGDHYKALVIARPTLSEEHDVEILDLPDHMRGGVARPTA